LGAALFAAGGHDRGDQAEGDGVVHALGGCVERLRGLALVEIGDQPGARAAAAAVAAGDGTDGVETQAELTVGCASVDLVGADALCPVPLDEAGEVALPRAHRTVQPIGGGAWRRSGEELAVADPSTVAAQLQIPQPRFDPTFQVHDTPPAVPHSHAVVEVAG